MERIKDFTQTKIGDVFVSNGQGYASSGLMLVKCTYITPKRVKINGWMYDKATGRGFDGERYMASPRIYEATPEARAIIKMANMRSVTHGRRTDDLTDDQVKRIYMIIKEQS